MNRALFVALFFELILGLLPWILLAQPKFLVGELTVRRARVYTTLGSLALSLFFAWSFVLGAMFALGRVTFWPLIQNP